MADVGHIHLSASALEPSRRFYEDVVGLELRQSYPGAAFMAEGRYHHHVAANTWHSEGAGSAASDEPGLQAFELWLESQAVVDAAAKRAERAGLAPTRTGDGVTLIDPDRTAVTLRARQPRD